MATELLPSLLAGSAGGLAVMGLTWIKEIFTGRRQREHAFLQEQAKMLYAPLHVWTTATVKACERAVRHVEIFQDDPQNIQRDPKATNLIELANTYWVRARKHNEDILLILRTSWHLVDPDDVDVFGDFLLHQMRAELEPAEVWQQFDIPIRKAIVEGYPVIPQAFVDRVNKRWQEKRQRLRRLAG